MSVGLLTPSWTEDRATQAHRKVVIATSITNPNSVNDALLRHVTPHASKEASHRVDKISLELELAANYLLQAVKMHKKCQQGTCQKALGRQEHAKRVRTPAAVQFPMKEGAEEQRKASSLSRHETDEEPNCSDG
eukprot:TRINITY_DN21244_c0_g1_i1.p1 TRINITY_DN21244_c0_g1~~TRINITY_DN21244_c0_g1_i1.p1  ORF type:complete len:134 (+),score=10.78 TRINITY_DN21244_c0_g1_i1:44-445(+)